MKENLVQKLKEDSRYKVLGVDKNCGLAVTTTGPMTRQAVVEHLSDHTV